MTPRCHAFVRELHLYAGLFLSPFVLVFAVSAVFFVHAWVPGAEAPARTRSAANLALPPNLERLSGREQIEAAHAVLAQAGVHGEIWNLRQIPRERRLVITVHVPGAESAVDLNVAARSATITQRTPGAWDATVYLHKMPGPHLVNIRGNSFFMVAWRWLADATVYLTLFLSLSGVYLWAALKAERRTGLAFLAAGALSFGGLVYALVA